MIKEKVNVLYLGTALTKAITIIIKGKIMKKSTTRIEILSIVPPKYPENKPTRIPMIPVKKVTIKAIDMEFRVPIIN
ncbi:hypothetical protein D3C76_1254700 [compost metagenome]